MSRILHITSGDMAGASLAKAGLPGEVFVWHDILHEGPRGAGWPARDTLNARAQFLEEFTAGGLSRGHILKTLRDQYQKLADAAAYERIVLWFDACLFDQSMLAHILACLPHDESLKVDLLCIDSFPGIDPFHGLGQLSPEQLHSRYDSRRPVTEGQLRFAVEADKAFADGDAALLGELARMEEAPLPWMPAAAKRLLQERPDPRTGLGRLESLALDAIRSGLDAPKDIYASVAAAEAPPQFWGDTTLWARINGLADREPPLVVIDGPTDRLPQWEDQGSPHEYRIRPMPARP